MTHYRRSTLFTFACFAALAACSERQSASVNGISVRDSAGTEIVEHTAEYIAALPEWTIDSVPLVHIAGDAPGNAFTAIRTVAQRPDGRFIVVEGRSLEIREFSATGIFERLIARGGRGPGEIEYVSRMQLTPEDSLVVFDFNQRRASVFAPGGAFVRQITYPRTPDGSRFDALALLNDKRLLGTLKKATGELVATDGPVTRSPFAIVRMAVGSMSAANDSAPAGVADTVTVVPDLESYPTASPSGGKDYPDMDFLIFGRRTNIAVTNHGIFVGTNAINEIDQYDANNVIRKIRSSVAPGLVTEAHREQVRAEIRNGFLNIQMPAAEKSAIQNYLLTKRRIADVFAFNESITGGSDSTLWVEDPRIDSQGGRKYTVYDINGHAIARAHFPERTIPQRLSRDRMLGVWLDGDDVPHVMLWKIVATKVPAQ